MRAAKIDSNQPVIVDYLRKAGATVQILAAMGKGVTDLLVGWMGDNYLVEVKAPKGKLTPDQVQWHGAWMGQVVIVHNTAEAQHLLDGVPLTEDMKPTDSHRRQSALRRKM